FQCIYKLKLSKFPLLSRKEVSKEIHGQKRRIPQNIANFYVTESEHGKLNIYYYEKSTWEKLSDGITRSLKDQSYECLDNASVAGILRKRSFGFSKVRLCPKEAGARPIANLKTPSRFCIGRSSSLNRMSGKCRKGRAPNGNNRATYFKSVNTVLRDLHLVIKDVKSKEPERWGSTVFCYNDIHRKFRLFLRHLKEGQAAMPVVYLVISDVQKAFDTIKQDKLLTILNEIQMVDKYSLQKSNEMFCRKKCVWSFEDVKLMSQTDSSGCSEVMSSAHRRTFHTVSVNQEQSRTIRREELLLILKEHLKNNVLKLGQCFFLQTVGIPQGSVLSTLLCTLYYGHMENTVIAPYLAKGANDVAKHSDSGCVALEATTDASSLFPKSMLL
ncbi:hypothetical protein KSS87_022469, partial [Heliosperma pusillum]